MKLVLKGNRQAIHLIVGAILVGVIVIAVVLTFSYMTAVDIDDILAGYSDETQYTGLTILYPLTETLFPPEIIAPTFRWKDDVSQSNLWLITIKFDGDGKRINFLSRQSQWKPEEALWETIKKLTLENKAYVTVLGVNRSAPGVILSGGRISISTSQDEVGAPLFYREVHLPFIDAVKDPSRIRWRFGAISTPRQPPVVLQKLPVCGNCHSFSQSGQVIGMDVDYANSKGSYVVTDVAEEMVLATSDIITWDDYRKDDVVPTFGLLSQVSPDGKLVISTVKDESVFVPKPGLAFSQLFFPIKGILCVYNRETKTFRSLTGADDPNYVQSNPSWSPDGKYIVFARSEVYKLKNVRKNRSVLLTPEECAEFLEDGKPFLFDLYKIPYNDGEGGKAEPLEGASNNGMSNYFARYSPDGKWIVFCKAKSYMLLQPDSELFIIPAEGGAARKLRANTSLMNSWHTWSPNGKWLAFSSKANTIYTQLFLTHIDEQGHSTPPVLLENFTAPDRAANIPEFVNAKPLAVRNIRERFVDDVSYVRAAHECLKANDYEFTARQCNKALSLNPKNADAHHYLGMALFGLRQNDEAITHLSIAVEIESQNAEAHSHLGAVYVAKGMPQEAMGVLSKAIRIDPNAGDAHYHLGVALYQLSKIDEAIKHWWRAIALNPKDADAHHSIALAMLRRENISEAIKHLLIVVSYEPDNAEAHQELGLAFARQKNTEKAANHLSESVRIDPNNGNFHYNLAIALASQGKTDETIKCLTETLKIMPGHAKAHYNLGIMLARKGKLEQAIEHWLEAVRIDPGDAAAMSKLGQAYAEIGKVSEAIKYTEKAEKLADAAAKRQRMQQMQQRLKRYKQNKSSGDTPGAI